MWAALHEHQRVDQALWDMALRPIHQQGCAACNRQCAVDPGDGSVAHVTQTPSNAFGCATA
jgi:hypothetical protein